MADTSWWDDLYAPENTDTNSTAPSRPKTLMGNRLPDWRKGPATGPLGPDRAQEPSPAPEPDGTAPAADDPEEPTGGEPPAAPAASADEPEVDGEEAEGPEPSTWRTRLDRLERWADNARARNTGGRDDGDDAGEEWEEVRGPTTRSGARLQQLYHGLPGQTRWFVLNGSAAAVGYWGCPLVHDTVGLMTACQQFTAAHNPGSTPLETQIAPVLITGTLAVLTWWFLDRRTRHWWGPLPWLLRIPLASLVLAIGLYAPGR